MNIHSREELKQMALNAGADLLDAYKRAGPFLEQVTHGLMPKKMRDEVGKVADAAGVASGALIIEGDFSKVVTLALLAEHPIVCAKILYPAIAYAGAMHMMQLLEDGRIIKSVDVVVPGEGGNPDEGRGRL